MKLSALVLLGMALLGAEAPLWAQGTSEPPVRPEREPAATGLALDLIGEPDGERLAGAELDRVTEEVSSLMRCPVCQGLSVADSPTTSALAMREEARDLLAAGYTETQVLAYFERSYGEFIRLWPKPEGFNLVVWLLPVAALLAGLLVIGLRLRRRESPKREASDQLRSEKADPETTRASSGIPEDLSAYAERVRREVSE